MPTLKQRRAVKELAESGRTSISAVMRDVGYSPASATKPSKLTKSKGFQELLDEMLPDDLIIAKHQQLLNAKKIQGSMTEPDRVVDDNQTQGKMVELGYKVKKKLIDKFEGEIKLPVPILDALNVSNNDSDKKDNSTQKEN